MTGYLFLGSGAVGLFDGRRWPTPDGGPADWVTGRVDSPNAIRAYRLGDLPYWLDDELWVVEVDGDIRRDPRLTRASRGRLCHWIDAWDAGAARAMALACAERAKDAAINVLRRVGIDADASALAACTAPEITEQTARRIADALSGPVADTAAYVADALFYARGSPAPGAAAAVSAYISARAVGCADPSGNYADAFAAERAWQATWLRDRAGLPAEEPM